MSATAGLATGLTAPEALVAAERHLFVSPHYDDIALSCGGTAALLSRAGRAPEVALVFGAEPEPTVPLTAFARAMHAGWGVDATGAIAARRAEEACAAALLGTRVRFLPFRDAIYRGDRYSSDDALFGHPAADEARLGAAIAAALDLPNHPDERTRVYVPLAIGNHVDHQHAYRAGEVLARSGWAVWGYEDLPYALRAGAAERRFAAVSPPPAVAALVEVGEVWETKLDAIFCYPSQLATIFGYVAAGASRAEIDVVMRRYAEAAGGGPAVERFWRVSSVAEGQRGARQRGGEVARSGPGEGDAGG
jgi:LmbE family N-acetylglucosaminyl deacetylase